VLNLGALILSLDLLKTLSIFKSMAGRNLHDKPFTEETITKLEIFEDYAQAWLPTFIMQGLPLICVFDFFAGTGYDKTGIPGSPIRLLSKINDHKGNIFAKKVKIKIFLNEYDSKKFESLKLSCDEYLDKNQSLKHIVDILYFNEDFETLFPKLLPDIKKYPALVYLDQNGIKFTSEKYFLELEKTTTTDFLYFISSSYFWRFGESDEFKMNLDINMEEAKKNTYKFIHVSIIDQLRKKLPNGTKLKLYPFSLKKGVNIHGIIFGASHIRAVDKFLKIAWERNRDNGQANFDIFDDATANQLDAFSGLPRRTRIQSFQDTVKKKILNGEIKDNFALFNYVMDQGFLGSHAADAVKELKQRKQVSYESSSPLVTYENVHQTKRNLVYHLVNRK
jgi:three-Cys-motif partner protein